MVPHVENNLIFITYLKCALFLVSVAIHVNIKISNNLTRYINMCTIKIFRGGGRGGGWGGG